MKRLVLVWAALMGLLLATWGAYYVDLGLLNTAVAMAIAVAKAVLVMVIFMELGTPKGQLVRIVALAGFFWLFLMVFLTASDFATRHPQLIAF